LLDEETLARAGLAGEENDSVSGEQPRDAVDVLGASAQMLGVGGVDA
jgi:hypothetical protein